MKRALFLSTILTATSAVTIAAAHADIHRLNVRFAGGCTRSNAKGTCVINVRADGHDFYRDALQLYSGSTARLKLASHRRRALSATGHAQYRVQNTPGACYQVRTAPNGNKRADHASAVLCEK